MPRDFLKRHLPSPDALRRRKGLAMFRGRMSDPELWHLTRRSVSAAIGVGLFLSMVPLPGQMPLAAVLALLSLQSARGHCGGLCRQPMPAVYLFAYELGALLSTPPPATPFEFTVTWLSQRAGETATFLGCFIRVTRAPQGSSAPSCSGAGTCSSAGKSGACSGACGSASPRGDGPPERGMLDAVNPQLWTPPCDRSS